MRWLTIHLSVALLALTTAAARPAAQDDGSATFAVLVQGVRIGTERVTVTRADGGFQIRGSSRLEPPIDIVTSQLEIDYGPEWRPQRVAVAGTFRGSVFALNSTFGPAGASSTVLQGGQTSTTTQEVAPDAVLLPNNFFAAYEALAARLAALEPGATVPVYIVPEATATATIDRVTPRRLATPDGEVEIREVDLTFGLPAGTMPVNVWVDAAGRLARVMIPASSIVAVREDISSVLAREIVVNNPTDETTFIPASGFSLGATITPPVDGNRNARPVILVAGTGQENRERVLYGVPIYGQLAGALAEAGFFVVRYDRRGLGQSGGRIESATLEDFAEDVRSVVSWLRRRDDVDDDRIALVAHGQSAAVAMIATRREGRVKALGLLAAPGGSGVEVTLEQQRRELAAMQLDEAERQRRIALQRAIIDAVLTGDGWAAFPPALQRQADTPLFRSWLQFNPTDTIRRIDEPMLILRGALDHEVIETDAERLAQLSADRGRALIFTRRVSLPGLNHLLVRAQTGEPSEYTSLTDRAVDAGVPAAIVEWLNQVMPPR